MERMGTGLISNDETEMVITDTGEESSYLTRVQVHHGASCVREEDFCTSNVSIGSSSKADLVLQHDQIAKRHAYLYIENHQVFIVGPPRQNKLLVNGKLVKAALIDPTDNIEIGPYTLKVQISSAKDRPKISNDIHYRLVFDGKIQKGHSRRRVAQILKKRLKLNGQAAAALFSGKSVTIKKDLNLNEAIIFKKIFEQSGAIGEVEAIIDSSRTDEKPRNGKSVAHLNIQGRSLSESTISSAPTAAEDEDDEEDDDREGSFSLREKLSTLTAFDRRRQNRVRSSDRPIGVFKFRRDAVIDVRYLSRKESYFINLNGRRFRLAQKSGSGKSYFYFKKAFKGFSRTKESGELPLDDLYEAKNLYRKRKGLYRIPLPDSGEVVVSDGCYEYLIRTIVPGQSPAVASGSRDKEFSWKHGAGSLLVHMVLLAVLSMLPISPPRETPEPETRFVRVDPHQLAQIQKKTKPLVKPPPIKPKAVKPAPKPIEKKAVVKKKPVVKSKKRIKKTPRRVTAKSRQARTKASKKTRPTVASRHAEAGGGTGKGNVRNRNVKQVGILSMLGDSTADHSLPVLAEVTNLDAVKSRNAGQAKFKVGGIKGKLGNSKIVVASSEVLATKGDTQVLRSSGAGGKGRVAALEKGSVGQKKVMGMVQARLNKSVKIRGGMSREAVKRTIEQHLDEITYCYETALISNSSIKGKITFEWKILMSGAVGEIRIKSSTVKSDEIYGCIKSAIKSWRFPKPVGSEVVVSYPFIFDIVGF